MYLFSDLILMSCFYLCWCGTVVSSSVIRAASAEWWKVNLAWVIFILYNKVERNDSESRENPFKFKFIAATGKHCILCTLKWTCLGEHKGETWIETAYHRRQSVWKVHCGKKSTVGLKCRVEELLQLCCCQWCIFSMWRVLNNFHSMSVYIFARWRGFETIDLHWRTCRGWYACLCYWW